MSLKIYKDIDQQSEEWFNIRKDKLTASNAGTIITAGEGLKTLIAEMMRDQYCTVEAERFKNKDTDRGNELEDEASKIYEMERKVKTEKVAFVELDENVGCSPDRFVGDDGLLEIKCPDDLNFMKIVLYGIEKVDKDYISQCKYQMYVTGRQWCDLMIYNPNYNFNKIIVFRILPDDTTLNKIKAGIFIGKELIKENQEKINKLIIK